MPEQGGSGDSGIYACLLTIVEFIRDLGGREKNGVFETTGAKSHHTQKRNLQDPGRSRQRSLGGRGSPQTRNVPQQTKGAGTHRMGTLARPLVLFPPHLGTSFIHRVVSCKEDRDEQEELRPSLLVLEGGRAGGLDS